MRKVLVESPYAGLTDEEIGNNVDYAQECLHDCFMRGEAPFASHLLYTQEGVLRDNVPEERSLGIEAGLVWGACADLTAVYADFGITNGMKDGIERAKKEGREVEIRYIHKTASEQ